MYRSDIDSDSDSEDEIMILSPASVPRTNKSPNENAKIGSLNHGFEAEKDTEKTNYFGDSSNDLNDDYRQLNDKHERLKSEYSNLLSEFETQVKKLVSQLQDVNEKKHALETKLSKLETVLEPEQGQDVISCVNSLLSKFQETNESKERFEKGMEEKEREVDYLLSKLADVEEGKKTAESKLDELRNTADDIALKQSQEITRLSKENTRIKSDLNVKLETALRKQVEQKSENDLLVSQIADLESKLIESERIRNDLKKNEHLEVQNQKLHLELEKLRQELDSSAEKRESESQQYVEELEEKLNVQTMNLANKDVIIKQKNNELEDLREQLTDHKEDQTINLANKDLIIEQKNKELEDLKEQLSEHKEMQSCEDIDSLKSQVKHLEAMVNEYKQSEKKEGDLIPEKFEKRHREKHTVVQTESNRLHKFLSSLEEEQDLTDLESLDLCSPKSDDNSYVKFMAEFEKLKGENKDLIGTITRLKDEKDSTIKDLEIERVKLRDTLEYVVEENENLKVDMSEVKRMYENKITELNETHEIIMEKLYKAMTEEKKERMLCS